jgi:hypothetical protein
MQSKVLFPLHNQRMLLTAIRKSKMLQDSPWHSCRQDNFYAAGINFRSRNVGGQLGVENPAQFRVRQQAGINKCGKNTSSKHNKK